MDELRLGEYFQIECGWFKYSKLLQSKLDKMVEKRNTHTSGDIPRCVEYPINSFIYPKQETFKNVEMF